MQHLPSSVSHPVSVHGHHKKMGMGRALAHRPGTDPGCTRNPDVRLRLKSAFTWGELKEPNPQPQKSCLKIMTVDFNPGAIAVATGGSIGSIQTIGQQR